ncbi:hypothetical protein AVEN_31449-1 [Araneus ventricosus]|uniref:Uncharacterized protein n=1 Tax=Araneus ventricosus TaxID=182803 RepID=A0A4Y2WSI2_ARAVE|nr:hypothetical protein AVEN_31449-1 [Araneus ventricosus]
MEDGEWQATLLDISMVISFQTKLKLSKSIQWFGLGDFDRVKASFSTVNDGEAAQFRVEALPRGNGSHERGGAFLEPD